MNALYRRIVALGMISIASFLGFLYCLFEFKDKPVYIAGISVVLCVSTYIFLLALLKLKEQREAELRNYIQETIQASVEKLAAENGEDKDANWLKAMGVYDNLAAKYPHTANFVKFQKGHQAYVCEKDDEAIGYLTGLINDLKAKGDLDEDEKGYLLNACSEVGYIYWASKNDLDTAKPFYETVIQLDPNNSIAKKALGLDAPAEEATE